MAKTGLHPELEERLSELAMDIAKLRRRANRAAGLKKIEQLAEVEQLEHRYKMLEEQLRSLDSAQPGFRRKVKSAFDDLVGELTGAIEDLIMRMDSGYIFGDRQTKPPEH